ncbi:AI-2E family transporter [Leptospira meyeri]|uniref:Putative PurR-regulated permease PerM n=1 Tax=Leptospira meyeri TaxID=29508 RepID=A0A4R8MT32_LEPME|nr:AI-2E family transporter [Leptospira meyeri]EKJ88380.1 PF01594 domain protein [Leptospira meyeri serovar Hardjo str. Went 5]EMJ89580.1 PF01594 domain protein [Leptospira meyeri serovar Semaranga str. Veldrot Semarang 173]MCW7489210.1 AI-2E family transporter [Leptospira meyeri]TDY72423.1 putative PurR-regulated permease PerM [Leptospira meyeri]TGL46077.1 AI-2E family transporter [Leptospira meyeri]
MNLKEFNISSFILRSAFFGLIALTVLIGVVGVKFLAIPLLISGIHFYIFHGIVDYFESRGVHRAITIIVIFTFLIAAAYWFLAFYLPNLFEKAQPIVSEWSVKMDDPNFQLLDFNKLPVVSQNPELWKKIIHPEEVAKMATSNLEEFLRSLVVMIPTFISWMIIIPIISFFLLLDANLIYKTVISFIPNRFFEMFLMVFYRMNQQITSYLKSLVIQCGIMAIVASIGFYLVGVKFFILFGVFLGVANSIPYLGPLVGAVPPILFSILFPEMSPSIGSIASVVVVAQLVDNAIVQPVVIANAVSLHPLAILIGIAVGGNFFGIFGMLLAIPVLSILKVTIGILYHALKEHQII